MSFGLPLLVAVLYLSVSVAFYRTSVGKFSALWSLIILVIANQMHAILLIRDIGGVHSGSFNLSIFNVMSIYAWTLACVSLFWLWKPQMALGGSMISIINMILVIMSLLFVSQKPFFEQTEYGIIAHILLSIAAWTLLTIAFIHAILYFYIFQQLKRKILKRYNMVALVSLERLVIIYIIIGLVLLLATLMTGLMFVDNLFTQQLWHKTVLTICAALVYLWTVYVFYFRQCRGMHLMLWSFLGYTLLLSGYMISNIVLQFIVSP